MVLREWKRPMKSNLIMASKKQRCLRYWKDIPGLAVCLLRSPNKMVHKKIPIFLCNISRSEHTCWKNYFNNYRRNDFPIKYHTTIIGRVYQRLKDCELKCSLKEMSHCNAISNSIKKLGIMRRRLNYDIGQGFLSSREKLLSSECSEGHNIEFNRSVQLNMLEILESREIRIFSLDRKVAAI
ncbi:uncharacterized protein [Venturia canescens]|uniref:uncharacterized protein n=1 Tax=Venturia canescens TaxID=32260 RepID=UPI001C9C33E2|nr:uncharacterized protein LOC122416406 [Venturia canescens]